MEDVNGIVDVALLQNLTELRSLSLARAIADIAPRTNLGELEELLLFNYFAAARFEPTRNG